MKRGICIGLNYENTPYELQGCAADARALKKRMQGAVESYYISQFEEFTGELSAETLFSILADFARIQKKSDTLYVTFSGHGTQLPANVEPDGYREGICLFTGGKIQVVLDSDVNAALAEIPGNVVMIFDSCYSGGMTRTAPNPQYRRKFTMYDPQEMTIYRPANIGVGKIMLSNRLYYLNACAEDEVSYDTAAGGVFTLGLTNAYDKTDKKHRTIKNLMRGAELFCKPDQSPFYECYGGSGGKRIF